MRKASIDLDNRNVVPAEMPKHIEPMLARVAERLPEGEGWAFEIKWDGVRAMVHADGGEARLASRTAEDLTQRYPELVAIGEALEDRRAILDGEIVAIGEDERPSFQLLQRRMGLASAGTIRQRVAETPVTFMAFDLLYLDDRLLIDEPYAERRRLLDEFGLEGPHWQAPRNHLGEGAALLDAARERDLEGIVAKALASPYRPGKRTSEWQKVRIRRRQELVIGGYMPGEGGRSGLVGSLLVGFWDATPEEAERLARPQRLVYAGGVGTGFTDAMLERLTELLEPLRRQTSPFELGWDPRQKYAARTRERGGLVWFETELV
jgi:bifunctional non-homologous end joining protein LigD